MDFKFSYCLLAFFLFLSNITFADTFTNIISANNEKIENLAVSSEWKKLLHVKPTVIGFERTQVRDPKFLLVKNGDRDRKTELVATLQALLNPDLSVGEEHAVCRFPSRKRWLTAKLNLDPTVFPKPDCKLYDLYRKRMKTKSISLVFSSYFADSPSSAFGHTFLRVSRDLKANQSKNELLDWGIGYAGEVDTKNPLVYIYNGLSGGFHGTFSSVPYYMKVREYNDYEARDLWSYELNLSQDEIDFLLDHLWEVGDHYFDYYFITQNCGYHLLTTLEASAPRLNLVDRVPFWVIPADALKAIVQEPGLVKEITVRPSILTQLELKYSLLTQGQQGQFSFLISDSASVTSFTDPEVIDTYISYFDYSSAKKIASGDSNVLEARDHLLLHRSKLPSVTQVNSDNMLSLKNARPDLSHPSGRVSFLAGHSKEKKEIYDLELRFALHDGLDPQNGYPLYSTVEMFRFNLHKDQESVRLDEFDFVGIESIAPINNLRKELSWSTRIGYRLIENEFCDSCSSYFFQMGVGGAKELIQSHLVAFAFLRGSLLTKHSILSPDVGLIWNQKPWALRFSMGPEWIFNEPIKYRNTVQLEGRWSFENNIFLRGLLQKQSAEEVIQIGGGTYF